MTKLTVLMTVYNGEAFLRETIDSVLNQTYRDFIFLILDNASIDTSREIICSYNDPRIKLEALPENIGQIAALNKGLDMIDTPLVARLDADDICMPARFAEQVAFMDANPNVGVCGTFAIAFEGDKETRWEWPTQPEDIKVKLLFECALAHPSVILRKEFFDKHNLRYNEEIGHSFDWELWRRAGEHFDIANIPKFLIRYRLHETNESKRTLHMQLNAAQEIDSQSLKALGLEDHPLRSIHRDVAYETYDAKNKTQCFLEQTVRWFYELYHANQEKKIYDEYALEQFLKERLFIVISHNAPLTFHVLKLFFKKKLYKKAGCFRSLKFIIKLFLSIFVTFK